MKDVALQLINLKKTINKKEIIKGISLQVNQGEVYGLIGPNGAGKTTTIRMIVGLMNMTDGDIKILGQSIRLNFSDSIRNVGAIVENPEFYPFMTGMQNLKHFAKMYDHLSEERIKEVVSLLGLEKVIHQKVKTYSLGMRQRLGIAQAILHKPKVLILDEPTNGLDPAGIREIREYIRKLADEEHVAVIISSHLLSEIELICDRIGIIQHGELISERMVDEPEVDENHHSKVIFDVKEFEQAQGIFNELQIPFEVDKHRLIAEMNREKIPSVIKMFVERDISIFGVTAVKASLEDQFLELTGGNVIE
ncbi:ABC transporter ATP-binding protein [Fervidibacillus halotolerans]|uniref:ABC transporter ATP-binding protein n=1 Tax=Fervidibacillus halotolerans TaxID=2980027 RepID=A0A9E8LYN4_9BACI|nr:ABC transporter ATP-binding protein [Fervidibacillus halotolerans]WAA12004.1 ABC transporter ATP-binding protein [Fervidibacillus halotolerans]